MLPINVLWCLLFVFILLSSFFSLAETAYMSVNRYRLKHLSKKEASAKRAVHLLERPDRLLAIVLLGDTLADIFAAAVSTLIAVHYWGEYGVFPATLILTFLVLIFGELAPKTLAARYAVPIVLYTSRTLRIILVLIYPVILLINLLSNGFLKLWGMRVSASTTLEHLTSEELRTLVSESGQSMSSNKQRMLLQLLDLEKIYVEDIMIPRHEMIGIDLDQPWDNVREQLMTAQHTRLPLYHENIENIAGMLHVRDILNAFTEENLTAEKLKTFIEEPYFIPEGTSLSRQLLIFCQQKKRIGLVVNEYGTLLGLVTLEDILEEIVGEFTTDAFVSSQKEILRESNGTCLIDGSTMLRQINRKLNLSFPLDGPRTLSGLIIEYLETIPPSGICVSIAGYRMEILQMKDNMVKTIRILNI